MRLRFSSALRSVGIAGIFPALRFRAAILKSRFSRVLAPSCSPNILAKLAFENEVRTGLGVRF